MRPDPLAPLLALPDVAAAVAGARERVDQALRHRALRRQGGQVVAEVSLRCAVASAALAGARYDLATARAGTVTDPVLQGALRCAEALPGLADRWVRAPRQVLARLHLLAARGIVVEADLGRPQAAGAGTAARLDALADIVSGEAGDPLVRAAVVHGELLALRPFAGPSDVVARAAARLTLISAGVDPRGLVAVDVGHQAREPEYVGAAGAFATGTPDGLRSWLRHHAGAVGAGAQESVRIADAVSQPAG